ncbi:MAG TPA: aminotransferase class V-fold PLP-dependent enzyme [Solirubrobacteraceae bacterium]
MDADALRAQFPVLEALAYLNAGTDGPVPAAAVAAAREELERELTDGRATAHFERRFALQDELRAGYAALIGAPPDDVALMNSTSEGIGRVLAGLDLGAGDEILTSDEEHLGLVGPLAAARARGAEIRMAPLARLHEAIRPSTTLVACSHVGWISGVVAPPELGQAGVPVVLDGAQGAGAVPVDVAALGCAAYAAAGQKWLCGADGTGFLYLEPGFGERVRAIAPSYMSFTDASAGLDAPLKPGARRHDTPALPREAVAFSAASLTGRAAVGWEAVLARAAAQSRALVERLAAAGRRVAPRGDTTLVAWEEDDAEAVRDRLAAAGVVVRNLPKRPLVRASVGAWTSDADLDRLVEAL